jgi:hypothetical protein
MAQVRALIEGGLTVREAAAAAGVSATAIWRRMKAGEIPPVGHRLRAPHPGMVAVLAALRDGCRTAPEVAEKTGTTKNCATLRLIYMEDRGLVSRDGTAPAKVGRAPIIWRIAEAAQ